jgi:hypothetical protein
MRYQERIYIQNDNGAVRNRDLLNINMSSDICVFNNPMYVLSGASKIDCSGYTGTTYVITPTQNTIPLVFDFTGNTNSFTANSATFKYEIYKYNTDAGMFYLPTVHESEVFQYSAFSGTNSISQSIPISGLSMDGEYLVKGYFDYDVCTEFMGRLGKTVDTLRYRGGSEYGLYDGNQDYFFRAIASAQTPSVTVTTNNTTASSGLNQAAFFPDAGTTMLVIPIAYTNHILLTLNGLMLSENYDYTISGNVITLSGQTVEDDIITMISGTDTNTNNLQGDTVYVSRQIVSGTTNNEGTNRTYYNTTTSKYEVYSLVKPIDGNNVIIMLNGATLSYGIDYYQSTTNPKRFILEGNLIVDDLITMVYYANTNVINGIVTNNPIVSWGITSPPDLINGYFSLEVSTGNTFNNFYYSGNTPYIAFETSYNDGFTLTGSVGTKLYYRIKNQKNYVTMCGDIVSSTAYSEIIPIVIQTNAINSY